MAKLKMWIGNLDGERQGLIIETSKERARKVVGTSAADFDGYWVLQSDVTEGLKIGALYTRWGTARATATNPWQEGRCRKETP